MCTYYMKHLKCAMRNFIPVNQEIKDVFFHNITVTDIGNFRSIHEHSL